MKENSSKRIVLVTKKNKRRTKENGVVDKAVHMSSEVDGTEKSIKKNKEGKISLKHKRKRKDRKGTEESPQKYANDDDDKEGKISLKHKRKRKDRKGTEDSPQKYANDDDDDASRGESAKHEKAKKKERKGTGSLKESEQLQKNDQEKEGDEIYNISSGDEDHSKGMRKWITIYHQSKPGLQVLQQKIDEFITDHESKLEQERKEREALAAEGGWTVVVHHKGRKKTTDSESGIAIGSVSQAAVENKLAKKKNKNVGLDFYRFQKREAKRNEIMALQNKFEEDKKRIQQLRAARKFKPY